MSEETTHSFHSEALEHLGSGGLLTMSKGRYRWKNPKNLVYFNARVAVQYGPVEGGKSPDWTYVWKGDFDLTFSEHKLVSYSKAVAPFPVGLFTEGSPEPDHVYSGGIRLPEPPLGSYAGRDDSGCIVLLERTSEPALREYIQQEYTEVLPTEVPEDEEDLDYLVVAACFEGVGSEVSPLHLFYKQVQEKFGIENEEAMRLYLSFEDFSMLQNMYRLWLEGTNPYADEYSLHQSLQWGMFQWGPNHFDREDLEWVQCGKLYRRVPKDE